MRPSQFVFFRSTKPKYAHARSYFGSPARVRLRPPWIFDPPQLYFDAGVDAGVKNI